jgi:hypothetical protein
MILIDDEVVRFFEVRRQRAEGRRQKWGCKVAPLAVAGYEMIGLGAVVLGTANPRRRSSPSVQAAP